MSYFNFIPVELIEEIVTKLEDTDDTGSILTLDTRYDTNHVNRLKLKYPYLYSQIKDILNINTNLGFPLYTNKDIYVFKKIYFDLINMYQSLGDSDVDLYMHQRMSNFPEIRDIFSMIILHEKYPKVYPYIKKYLKWNFGAYLFATVIFGSDMYPDMYLRNYPNINTAFQKMILGENLRNPIIIDDDFEFDDCDILKILFVIHIMRSISPENIMTTDNFKIKVSSFEDVIDGNYIDTFAEYEKYKSIYFYIIRDLEE